MCKFGENCNRLQTNSCNFYHPPNQMPNMGNQGGMGKMGNQGGNGPKPWQTNPNPSFGHHQPKQYPPNDFNSQQGQQGGYKEKGNDMFYSLCRNFQLGQPCQYA